MRRRTLYGFGAAGMAAAMVAGILALSGTASAAALEKVSDFGPNPGGLTMYVYRPDGLRAGAPAVVLMHGCRMQASGLDTSTGWRKFADRYKFTLVLPEKPNRDCFAFGGPRGQGDAASVASMVGYARATYGTDPARVFATGFSAGGGMTNTMLATYPDLFAAGAPVSGIPYRCSSTANCTAAAVIGAYPGYTGPRPRVQIWHGTADRIVDVSSGDGTRLQWTSVLGAAGTPARTEQLKGQTTRSSFTGPGGTVVVEDYRLAGLGHLIPIDPGTGADRCGSFGATAVRICYAYHAAAFFGLVQSPPAVRTASR